MVKDISKAGESRQRPSEPGRNGVARPTPDANTVELAELASRPRGGLPVVQRRAATGSSVTPNVGNHVADGGGTSLPSPLAAKMEHAFGTSFSGVRVHADSGRASRLGALAFTAGEHVHFAPGQYRPNDRSGHSLVGHELAHVVQQRGGRVEADVQYAGVEMSTDRSLEDEADRAGELAARGERVHVAAPPSAPSAPPNPVVQAKLGFELEMLILVDTGGRPLPEKSQIGTFGNHISLDVDQGPDVDSPTPTAPSVANYDLPQSGDLTKIWYDANTSTVYDTEDEAKAAVGDTLPGITIWYWDDVVRRYRAEADVDWTVEWFHQGSNTTYASQALAETAHPGLAGVVRRYKDARGTVKDHHVDHAGMGNDRYASILEMVTAAYEPETVLGAQNIIAAMTEAKELADAIEGESFKTERTQLNTISNKFHNVHDSIHFGHTSQAAQTTDASIQTTLGLDIAQMASFVLSTMGAMQYQSQFVLKHDSDYGTDESWIPRAHREELAKAMHNATAIINEIGHTYDTDKTSTLVNFRGLLILACQYLRMGKYAYNRGKFVLDKNLTPMLSRTDLSTIRENQLTAAEKLWLTEHLGTLKTKIYAKTGRTSGTTLYTDPTETQVYAHIGTTVAEFVDNVFAGASDGVTEHLGGFKRLGAEDIDPSGAKGHKTGPVFELRNMIPANVGDRFPRSSWIGLATYMYKLLATLNARTDADAVKDTRVTMNDDLSVVTSTASPRNW